MEDVFIKLLHNLFPWYDTEAEFGWLRELDHVFVCTHVGAVHVDLAGCQWMLPVVSSERLAVENKHKRNNERSCVLSSGSLCTPARLHTSHVPRCEKDGRAPPATSLPKLPEVSLCVSERRSLPRPRRDGRTLWVTRPCWKSYCVKRE